MIKKIVLAIALAIALAGAAIPAAHASVPAPFTYGGVVWCPTYQEQNGCNTVQHPNQYSVSFDPAQVSFAGVLIGDVEVVRVFLAMNSGATLSGAMNTQGNETWTPPVTVYENVLLPCNASGQIENWPAFWMDGTVGSWPAHGEIDLVEGLSGGIAGAGAAYWHYHYLNASGQSAQVGGKITAFVCNAWNTYSVHWTATSITFSFNDSQVGLVKQSCSSPCKSIGVPIVTDPMYVINDYGASNTVGGPIVPNAAMGVGVLTVTSG